MHFQLLIIHYAPSSGQSVALWDLSLGKQAWTYNGHGDQVRMISFYVGFVWHNLNYVSISIVHGWTAAEYFRGIFRNRCKRWPGSGKEVWLRHRLAKVFRTFFRLKTLEKILMVFHLQAKDRTLRILDPRADVTASETKSHDGIKDSKVGQVGKQLPFQGNQVSDRGISGWIAA